MQVTQGDKQVTGANILRLLQQTTLWLGAVLLLGSSGAQAAGTLTIGVTAGD